MRTEPHSRRAALGLLAGILLGRPAAAAARLSFEGLYSEFGVRGLVFAPRTLELTGKPVDMIGYLAPPLKAESRFFVLAREPLALCPFCQSDADWPLDIVVVLLRRTMTLLPAGAKLLVSGRLETGSREDAETGFVSQIRIADADFRRA